jgi:hypothetical protein
MALDLLLAEVWRMVERAPGHPLTSDEHAGLVVLADAWIAEGLSEGEALADTLRETERDPLWALAAMTEDHARWRTRVATAVDEVRHRDDPELAARWLSWLRTLEVGKPLNAILAVHLAAMLARIERRELAVTERRPGPTYLLENGWQLRVFVRGYDFWRIDSVIAPTGHEVHLVDFPDESPLGQINEYEPPPDVEAAVYGLGFRG